MTKLNEVFEYESAIEFAPSLGLVFSSFAVPQNQDSKYSASRRIFIGPFTSRILLQ